MDVPFSFVVLVARLRALARRGSVPRPRLLGHGGLTLDPESGECTVRGDTAALFGGDSATLPPEAPARLSLLDKVQAVSATAEVDATVRRSDQLPATNTKGTVVLAADSDLPATLNGKVAAGHWLDEGMASYPVVVLGSTAAQRQGVDLAHGGQLVWLGDQWFAVVGVLDPMPLALELDTAALVSPQIAAEKFGYTGSPTTVYVRADPADIHTVRDVAAPTANPVSPSEVDVTRPSDALAARAATDTAFTTLLRGLGGVALLVGGVGIANVMVISALERCGGRSARPGGTCASSFSWKRWYRPVWAAAGGAVRY